MTRSDDVVVYSKSDAALKQVKKTQRYVRWLASIVAVTLLLIQLTMLVRAELYHACTATYLEEIVKAVNTRGVPIEVDNPCPQRLNAEEKK